jgi:hypothetical protein
MALEKISMPGSAASVALHTPLATAAPRNHAGDRGAPASLPTQRAEPLGPPTTRRMTGAGGPLNDWDKMIDSAKARGDHKGAAALQVARAKWNIALRRLEPVMLPMVAQQAFYRAARDGVATVAA